MQPIISVDRESRNAHRSETEANQTESTPLVPRTQFHQREGTHNADRITTFIVVLLLIILISGIVIGIYLLVLQSNAENVLPPVEASLRLVRRSDWDNGTLPLNLTLTLYKAKQVVAVQTDTEQCNNSNACVNLLKKIKLKYLLAGKIDLPYNFMVSSQGETYEVLGWKNGSPMSSPTYPSLVIGFIGDFTQIPPTDSQLVEAKSLIAESVSLQHLDASFIIVGKNTTHTPTYLFKSLQTLPQWANISLN